MQTDTQAAATPDTYRVSFLVHLGFAGPTLIAENESEVQRLMAALRFALQLELAADTRSDFAIADMATLLRLLAESLRQPATMLPTCHSDA